MGNDRRRDCLALGLALGATVLSCGPAATVAESDSVSDKQDSATMGPFTARTLGVLLPASSAVAAGESTAFLAAARNAVQDAFADAPESLPPPAAPSAAPRIVRERLGAGDVLYQIRVENSHIWVISTTDVAENGFTIVYTAGGQLFAEGVVASTGELEWIPSLGEDCDPRDAQEACVEGLTCSQQGRSATCVK
jgi:hypothetical protein